MRQTLQRQLILVSIAVTFVLIGTLGQLIWGTHRIADAASFVGPKPYYLALGDSLAFGYQPDLNWDEGYVQDYYANLQQHHVSNLTNYGCLGETSVTMIAGGCPYKYVLHNYYWEPQLTAALAFLHAHPGQVSPVTLDMGANDVLPDINITTCTVSARWSSDLATLQHNLNTIILPQLKAAMTIHGQWTGDLVMMNYYDPFIKACPQDVSYVSQLNSVIASAANGVGAHLVNVFNAYGGTTSMASNICTYTWICSIFSDIHPKTAGYQVIANAIEAATGY